MITAALKPKDALYYKPAFFYAAETLTPQTSFYPVEESNDYIRAHPEQEVSVWRDTGLV